MTRLRTLTLVLTGLTLAGCTTPDTGPAPGLADPYPAPYNNPQITVLSPELRDWLGVHPATIMDVPPQPMEVQVPVRNLTERQYLVDYRFLFYDVNGVEMEPAMGWTMVAFEPKQTINLQASALDTDARNYRLELKWAR